MRPNFQVLFWMSLESLRLNKLRTALAVLGIVIAVAAIVLMGFVGENAKAIIYKEIDSFGFNTVWFYRKQNVQKNDRYLEKSSGIRFQDFISLPRFEEDILWLSPVIESQEWAENQGVSKLANLYFVNEYFYKIENDQLLKGRYFTKAEVNTSAKLCVIGEDLAKALFGLKESIGKQILIGQFLYQIVGVFKSKSRHFLNSIATSSADPNSRIHIPFTVALDQKGGQIDYLQFSVKDSQSASSSADKIIRFLKQKHTALYDYDYTALQTYIDAADRILNVIKVLLLFSLALALLIGGIGIANIMSISVIERRQEIAIRKALGATAQALFLQFLMESLCITVFAASVGIVLASTFIVALVCFWSISPVVPFYYGFIALILALCVGLLSGILPAQWAARQNPAAGLRSE